MWSASRLDVFMSGLPTGTGITYGLSGRALIDGRFSTLFTASMLTRDVFMAVSIVVSLLVFLGLYEWLVGWWRTLLVAVSCTIVGSLVVTAGLWIGSALGWEFADRTLGTIDYGASAMTAGGAGALVAVLRIRWLRYGAFAVILGGVLLHHQVADWIHVVAFGTGFLLSWRLGPVTGTLGSATAASTPQRRPVTLEAMRLGGIALALGVGLVVASFATIRVQPLSVRTGNQAGAVSGTSAEGPASPADVVVTTYHSDALDSDRRVVVVLPPNYDGGRRRYPVVEMLHGWPGTPEELLVGLDVVRLVSSMHFIAVLPDGNGPKTAEGDYADVPGQRLGTATGPELRRWVDRRYRTTARWSVAGLSSGGFGAAYLGAFGGAAYDSVCPMSGHFTPVPPAFEGVSEEVRAADSPLTHVSAEGPRTMLVVGENDAPAISAALQYIAAMDRVGQRHAPLVTEPGGHDTSVWKPGIERCVRFALQQ